MSRKSKECHFKVLLTALVTGSVTLLAIGISHYDENSQAEFGGDAQKKVNLGAFTRTYSSKLACII